MWNKIFKFKWSLSMNYLCNSITVYKNSEWPMSHTLVAVDVRAYSHIFNASHTEDVKRSSCDMLAILLHLDFQSVQWFDNVFELIYLGCCLNTRDHYCHASRVLWCSHIVESTRNDLFVVEYSFKWKLQFITNHNRNATTQYCIEQPSWGWGVSGWT